MRSSLIFVFTFFAVSLFAQSNILTGTVQLDSAPADAATVSIAALNLGVTTAADGTYSLPDLPQGTHEVVYSYIGYEPVMHTVIFSDNNASTKLNINLTESRYNLNSVVVTGTKTFKRKTDSPVIVNVVSGQALENVQACNLSEGLKFQPGLRVETDCQTCNYTQLRMNGLAGGYSQILVNGRPVFSPLTGLYGLEQLPVNMIERIEVVRGGGSSLYGSSAVGGTVNVITKIPDTDSYQINYTRRSIDGQAAEHIFDANSALGSEGGKTGAAFFLNRRSRDLYDRNADKFSELSQLENTAFGTNLFFLPTENQKLEVSFSSLNEYRYGGQMTDRPTHLAEQAEERTHRVLMGNADYQVNFNDENTSFLTYAAWQNTDREHYTGILPDTPADIAEHSLNPPYGDSRTVTLQGGLQLNHRLSDFLGGTNVLTLGSEYTSDEVYDEIPAYKYLIDQTTTDLGVFVQSDWQVAEGLTILSGIRADRHNLVKKTVLSPRFSLLYKLQQSTQFRLSYGTGFRAPQAFDTDLHIAFAGGGVSRVMLSPDLLPERSASLSGSINYDKIAEKYIAGFTLEGFRTRLHDAFILESTGEDAFGEVFAKRNGQGATVQGLTVEIRANYNRKLQLESGLTRQTNEYDTPVTYTDGTEGITEFIRTPRTYGFATVSITPGGRLSANVNYVYTGRMKVPHFAGAPGQETDEIITSDPFSELSFKAAYVQPIEKIAARIEFYGGIKNIFDAYQNDFDLGKNRDSNFVYGPGLPRTFFVGVKFNSLSSESR